MKPISTNAALRLILDGAGWIDVRSESEFAKGALPGAMNAPILEDEERQQVGLCYNNKGQQAAIALGHQLVGGEAKAARIAQWQAIAQQHPLCGLYCWRGGLRSQLAADWLADTGLVLPRIKQGYKAVRNQLLQQLETLPGRFQMYLIGGRTGSGKTALLKKLPQLLDLEGLAHHRGSAFGAHIAPQPTIPCFEHRLAVALLQADPKQRLFVEDEGAYIGQIHLPNSLTQAMLVADIIRLEIPRTKRVQYIYDEYILDGWANFKQHFAKDPWVAFQQHFEGALQRIQKRLGGLKFQQINHLMQQAFQHQAAGGDLEAHKLWVDALLEGYYDPMYNYQQAQKQERILFTGDHQAVLDFIRQHHFKPPSAR